MKLTLKEDSQRERVLVFGGPKAGKSLLAGSLAEEFNLHYFDFENGYKTLRLLPKAFQERINLYSIPDTKVWPIAIETGLKVVTGLPTTFCTLHGKVTCLSCKAKNLPTETVELNALNGDDVVVFDSGTQLALSAMSHIKSKDDELDKPTWDNYASQGFLMDKFLSQCQQAKYNLVFITHEIETELENGGKKLVAVAGTRDFSRNSAKYFDHVVYCELKNKKHAFGSATDYAISVLTGSRSDTAIEKLAKPSLLPFFKHEIARTEDSRKLAAAVTAGITTNAAMVKEAVIESVKVAEPVVEVAAPVEVAATTSFAPPKEDFKARLARLKTERGIGK